MIKKQATVDVPADRKLMSMPHLETSQAHFKPAQIANLKNCEQYKWHILKHYFLDDSCIAKAN